MTPSVPDTGPALAGAARRAAHVPVLRWVGPALGGLLLLLLWRGAGYNGGPSDDRQYLDIARAWAEHGPQLGTTHWALRAPLIVPLAAGVRLFGESQALMLWLPMLGYLGLAGVTLVGLGTLVSTRAALLWGMLFAATPIFHELGTRFYPEIFELFFAAAAGFAVMGASREEGRARTVRLVAAGALAGLAFCVRETTLYLVPIYAVLLAIGRPVSRRDLLLVAAGAAPVVVGEMAIYGIVTGNPLYRPMVDLHHVEIPSYHMQGGVSRDGNVLMSAGLAERWVPPGPVKLHWAVNPVLNLFADTIYGLTFWFALVGGMVAARQPADAGSTRLRLWVIAVLAMGAVSFVFATYVLMLSQRYRYYAAPAYAALIAAALVMDHLWVRYPRLRKAIVFVIACHALNFVLLVSSKPPRSVEASAAVRAIAATSGTVRMDADFHRIADVALRDAGLAGRVRVGGPVPVGELELVVMRPEVEPARGGLSAGPACCWRPVAEVLIRQPWTRQARLRVRTAWAEATGGHTPPPLSTKLVRVQQRVR